jgi:DNA-binding NarL/FixJ family response regulator
VSYNLEGGDPATLYDIARYDIRPLISRVPGVGRVDVQGSDVREIEVIADPARLAAQGMTYEELAAAIRAAIRGNHGGLRFELVPIRDGEVGSWIAIMKTSSPDAHIAACVERCRTRWALTPRQTEVLGHVTRGASNATIATIFACVERTVELHITAIFDAAGVDSRSALVAAVLTSLT